MVFKAQKAPLVAQRQVRAVSGDVCFHKNESLVQFLKALCGCLLGRSSQPLHTLEFADRESRKERKESRKEGCCVGPGRCPRTL